MFGHLIIINEKKRNYVSAFVFAMSMEIYAQFEYEGKYLLMGRRKKQDK